MPAPALQAAGAALTGRSLLPRALVAAAVALLGLLLLVAAPIALLSAGGGSGPSSVPDGIPGAFVPVYRESARAFHLDWLLLAAVHQQETGFSTNPTTYHGLNAAGLLRRAVSVQPHQRPAVDLGQPQARLPQRRPPGRLPAPAGAAPVGL